MTLDEYCRLAAIHFEPQHRAAMTAFWKKYGDRNFIDRSLDQAEKQLNFESTIYFNNNLSFMVPTAVYDDENHVCYGVDPSKGAIDYNRSAQDLYLRWTELRSKCVCCFCCLCLCCRGRSAAASAGCCVCCLCFSFSCSC